MKYYRPARRKKKIEKIRSFFLNLRLFEPYFYNE